MNDNFVFIGDSLTYGYGVKKNDCWVNKLEKSLEYTVINKGVNGSTTTDMLVRFHRDVLSYNPNKVFIMGGTNDLLSNRSITSIIENIECMIKDLMNKQTVIIIGIPPTIITEDAYKLFMPSSTYSYCNASLPLLRSKLISLCNTYNCTYIDFYSLTIGNLNKLIYLDGIHLNELGQTFMFEEAQTIISNS